ncbi:MAG: sugar phosphate isomerase/epimerase [Cytophagaceae bacterium]|nr:sugar phosphate isomerase/epimerase [Cytophagaceae bacterium]
MKNFLLLALLLSGVSGTSYGQKFGKLLKEMPGVQTYTFRVSMAKDVPGTLDKIKAMGFTNIEGGAPRGVTTPEFRAMLDARGIRCTSTGAGYDALADAAKTAEVIEKAKILGAEFIMTAWIPHKGAFDLATAQKAVADFNRAGKQFKEAGLTFCYHNHGYEFEKHEDGTLFDYIVKNTDPNYVSFEIDILWTFFPGQDPAALINKYPQRFKLMHMKDLKKGVEGNLSGGTPQENDVVLGTGQLDIPAILKAARKSAIKYYYIEDESPQPDQQVPETLAYLKSL